METIWLTDRARVEILTELYFLRSYRRTSQFVSFLASLFCSDSPFESHLWSWRNQLSNLHLIPAQTLSTPKWSWERRQMFVAAVQCRNYLLPWSSWSQNFPYRVLAVLIIFSSRAWWWNWARCSLQCFHRGFVCYRNDFIVNLKQTLSFFFKYKFCHTKSANNEWERKGSPSWGEIRSIYVSESVRTRHA